MMLQNYQQVQTSQMHDDMNHCIKQCWGICVVHSAHTELISWPIRSHVVIFPFAQGRWAGASSHAAALLLHPPQPCTKLCLMALSREVQEKWEWRKKGKESLLVRLKCTAAFLGREPQGPWSTTELSHGALWVSWPWVLEGDFYISAPQWFEYIPSSVTFVCSH